MADQAQKIRTPDEKNRLIEYALETLYNMGFNLQERALLLGYSGDVGDNLKYLHLELTERGKGTDVEKRCELIAYFDALLAKIGHADAASKKRYLEWERYTCLNGKTFKEFLIRGHLADLEFAVEQLSYMST